MLTEQALHRIQEPGRVKPGMLLIGGVVLAAGPGLAGSLPQPTDKPILTVTGKIANTNKDSAAQFVGRDTRYGNRVYGAAIVNILQ